MHRICAIAVVVAAALSGAAASHAATITDFNFDASSSVFYPGANKLENYGATGAPPSGLPGVSTNTRWGGANFISFVSSGDAGVSFESSNTVSKIYPTSSGSRPGEIVQAFSGTTVSFTFTNDGSEAVRFDSLITAAGLGYYLAKVDSACAYSGCPEVSGVGLLTDVSAYAPFDAASAGFEFVIQDNGRDLFRVSGGTSLSYNDDGDAFFDDQFGTGFYGAGTGARGLLKGFTLASDVNDAAAHGFAWNDTPVSFLLGTGVHHLTYTTQVRTSVNALTLSCGANVLAYSGFGDPIGRAGAVEEVASFGFSSFSSGCPADGPIRGLNFTPSTFDEPTVDGNGKLVYGRQGGDTGGVPEPATWATMIVGFGAIGTVLRRRRVMGAAA